MDTNLAAVLISSATALAVHFSTRAGQALMRRRRADVQLFRADAEVAAQLRDDLARQVRECRAEVDTVRRAHAELMVENARLGAEVARLRALIEDRP
jgi:uncharacterized coiled-coil DUF342 family protein